MNNEGYVFTSRYGNNLPDPKTMCGGDCEGIGVVPVLKDDEGYEEKWAEAERLNPNPPDDKYHFVVCNDCNGTGKK